MTCEQTGEPPRGLDTMRNTDTHLCGAVPPPPSPWLCEELAADR